MCPFGLVAVSLTEVACLQHLGSHLPCNGHQAHVDEVRTSRTAQMRMGESVNLVLVVVVSRARVPGDVILGFRTQLHHPLRHRSPREGTSAQRTRIVGLCANEGIHIRCVVLGMHGTEGHCPHECHQ